MQISSAEEWVSQDRTYENPGYTISGYGYRRLHLTIPGEFCSVVGTTDVEMLEGIQRTTAMTKGEIL